MRKQIPLARHLVFFLVAGLGAFSAAYPQPVPPEGFAETLEVQLVDLEVVATDGSGTPIYDLRKGDFEVFEDGRPVAISHFQPPDSSPKGPDSSGGSGETPKSSRPAGAHIVIFVDNLNTGPARRHEIFGQLYRALKLLGPDDRVMVVSFDGGIDVRLPFTTNHRQVLKVLRAMETPVAQQLAAGLEEERVIALLSQSVQLDTTCVMIEPLPRAHAQRVRQRVRWTIHGLVRLVSSLGGVPGHKSLVYISDGVPLVAGAEVYQHAIELCDGSLAAQGLPGGQDTRAHDAERIQRFDPATARVDMLSFDTTPEWQRLTAQANAQQVTFYPLQASGLGNLRRSSVTAGHRTTAGTETALLRNQQNSLVLMAEETGGVALLNANDFERSLQQVFKETHSTYAIAFTPLGKRTGQSHSVEVKVTRPGIRLRYGKSYRLKTRDDRLLEGLFSTLFYGSGENPDRAHVTLRADSERETDRVAIEIWVRVPLTNLTLLPEGDSHRGLFTVFVLASRPSGRTTEIRRKTFRAHLPQDRLESDGEEYTFVVSLEVQPGEHRVAVALRDELGDTTSFVRKSLRVAG